MKFLTVGDQHVDVTGPLRRTDRYIETVWAKLEEIRDLAQHHAVKAIVWTGDLFDRPDGARVPYWMVNRLIDYFRSFRSTYPIAHLMALGNHDIRGSFESWDRQPIGALVRSRAIVPLWLHPEGVEPAGTAIDKIRFSSPPYDDNADLAENRDRFYGVDVRGASDLFHVRVVHTMMVPNGYSLPEVVPHTTPDDIVRDVRPGRLADLYVGGHVHDDFGRFGDTAGTLTCLNYGSLTRLSIGQADLIRRPGVGLVEVQDGKLMSVRKIDLQTAKPPAEIFDLGGLEVERQHDQQLERLAAALQSNNLANEFRLIDPFEVAETVLGSYPVTDEVKHKVRDLIGRARNVVA
jgi:DNA repair exonuclease SbcCD nuclease subunit